MSWTSFNFNLFIILLIYLLYLREKIVKNTLLTM